MFIDKNEIAKLDNEYGPVRRVRFEPIKMLDWEYRLLVHSGRNGRRHDVTMFIRKSNDSGRYVCIQKPYYRDSGIFRAPSGGVNPGESVINGLKREMREETGLDVELDAFPLITETEFVSPDGKQTEPWTSYIFTGHDIGGEMETLDPREISEVKLFSREDLLGAVADIMLESGWGGFRYRVKLTREAFSAMDKSSER